MNVGYFDDIKERLDKQFISVTDSITFIFHQDSCTYQDAFNLVIKTLIFEQTHLLVIDELKLKTIFICRAQDPNSHNAHITVEALTSQFEQQQLDSTNKNISNIGFGKKRFYEQLLNMGFVFDNRLLFEAQSPDIDYSDCETEADDFAYYNGLPKEYEALKRSHDKLEQQLADEKAKDHFGMGTPKLEQGEPKDSEQIISDLRDQVTQLTAENNELKKQLKKANTALADAPADEVQLTGIAKYNADKAMVITTAKAIAKYIWSMDSTEAIRTGDMMQQVRHVMHNIEPELLPDDKAIREWLSGIAPDYAKKAGKPSKNAPDEISLTMKK